MENKTKSAITELEADPKPERKWPCQEKEREKACKPNVLVYLRKGGLLSKSLPSSPRKDPCLSKKGKKSKSLCGKLPKCDYEYKGKPTDTHSKGRKSKECPCKEKGPTCPPLKPKSKPVEIPQPMPTNSNYKDTPTCSTYIKKEITSFKKAEVDGEGSQDSASEITLEGVEMFEPLDMDVQHMTTREYIEKFVMPTVNIAMQDLLCERPPNPVEYLIKYLKDVKYACKEPPAQAGTGGEKAAKGPKCEEGDVK